MHGAVGEKQLSSELHMIHANSTGISTLSVKGQVGIIFGFVGPGVSVE